MQKNKWIGILVLHTQNFPMHDHRFNLLVVSNDWQAIHLEGDV